MSRQISLIEERTGANVRRYSQMFKLNPKVDDIASQFAFSHKGVSLLVLGTVPAGGNGCACPYNTFVRALVADLVLFKNETLIMDMEAGIEHLGRATSSGVDLMAIVVEPGQRSIDSALTISRMAGEIGLRKTVLIGNKATDMADEQFIRHAFPDREVLIVLPYSEELRRSDRDGVSVLDSARGELAKRMRKLSEEMERLSK